MREGGENALHFFFNVSEESLPLSLSLTRSDNAPSRVLPEPHTADGVRKNRSLGSLRLYVSLWDRCRSSALLDLCLAN